MMCYFDSYHRQGCLWRYFADCEGFPVKLAEPLSLLVLQCDFCQLYSISTTLLCPRIQSNGFLLLCWFAVWKKKMDVNAKTAMLNQRPPRWKKLQALESWRTRLWVKTQSGITIEWEEAIQIEWESVGPELDLLWTYKDLVDFMNRII